MEKRNSLKCCDANDAEEREWEIYIRFFFFSLSGDFIWLCTNSIETFSIFVFSHWMCGTFFSEMEHTVIIRGKGLTIVKPFISVTLFMCFMAAIIVSVRTVVAAAAAVIFIEIKWISRWMMSSSLSSYSHSHTGHWNRPLRMNCIGIWPKVTQELLFIAFHINQVLWYSHRQMCKTHWRRNCCGFFRSMLSLSTL